MPHKNLFDSLLPCDPFFILNKINWLRTSMRESGVPLHAPSPAATRGRQIHIQAEIPATPCRPACPLTRPGPLPDVGVDRTADRRDQFVPRQASPNCPQAVCKSAQIPFGSFRTPL